MALALSTATRNALADAITTRIDLGSGAGTIKFYTAGAVLLVTLTYSDPSFGAASTGVITASAITNGTAVADGTATNASILDSDANIVMSGLVIGAGSGDINMNSTSVTTGDIVAITSHTITVPA